MAHKVPSIDPGTLWGTSAPACPLPNSVKVCSALGAPSSTPTLVPFCSLPLTPPFPASVLSVVANSPHTPNLLTPCQGACWPRLSVACDIAGQLHGEVVIFFGSYNAHSFLASCSWHPGHFFPISLQCPCSACPPEIGAIPDCVLGPFTSQHCPRGVLPAHCSTSQHADDPNSSPAQTSPPLQSKDLPPIGVSG